MTREIKLKNSDDAAKIATTFGVTTRTVYSALSGKTGNEQSRKIRNVALKFYDAKYIKTMPQEGVVTTRSKGVITHYFYGKTANGESRPERSLSINNITGEVTEYKDGKVECKYGKITVARINALLLAICEDENLRYNEHF